MFDLIYVLTDLRLPYKTLLLYDHRMLPYKKKHQRAVILSVNLNACRGWLYSALQHASASRRVRRTSSKPRVLFTSQRFSCHPRQATTDRLDLRASHWTPQTFCKLRFKTFRKLRFKAFRKLCFKPLRKPHLKTVRKFRFEVQPRLRPLCDDESGLFKPCYRIHKNRSRRFEI